MGLVNFGGNIDLLLPVSCIFVLELVHLALLQWLCLSGTSELSE